MRCSIPVFLVNDMVSLFGVASFPSELGGNGDNKSNCIIAIAEKGNNPDP